MRRRRVCHAHFGVLVGAPAAHPKRGDGRLLVSESSRGSSSAHEVHVPQARGRRRLQAANASATCPGRVLTGFHKANEVLIQTSWLVLFRRMRLLLKES